MFGDSTEAIPDRGVLRSQYECRSKDYAALLDAMEAQIRTVLESFSLRPTIKGRVKSFDSLFAKQIRLLREARISGKAPIPINDIIALRAVCPFLGDLSRAERALCTAFSVLEVERKGSERSFREFGYESIHLLLEVPRELGKFSEGLERNAVEVQLRTILQEAWAEVEHELVYKAEFTPFDEPMKRKLAALNANLSLSDIIFQEILDYQRRLNVELERRRSSFHGKIEFEMDSPFGITPSIKSAECGAIQIPASPAEQAFNAAAEIEPGEAASLDDLLLAALTAHNREDFGKAARIYGSILAQEPTREIAGVVYKHRGMAFFSCGRYDEAISDFGKAIEIDPRCYKAAYYRGVVHSVLQQFPEAIADFDQALDIHPFHFYSRYRRGMAWWHLGDFTQALADSEAALKLEPSNPSVKHLKELALAKLKM